MRKEEITLDAAKLSFGEADAVSGLQGMLRLEENAASTQRASGSAVFPEECKEATRRGRGSLWEEFMDVGASL